ncbi:response regulator transcription factor [Microbacterium imperiale]|uniref:DNA-binding response regulator n=1 Tax=Microbacterium imperiale TaxID=33884 RepID=A0A9W6HEW5_9MICO|nr:response regulator transcription factor [Microbacterium imperiale]MBP2419419.1 DNA-binding response OmpR family regulator [Microbacterium imperiale]MDS0198711.1 response regulator transcription factor [Microbacterium imperiale]BFE39761.1 response regulator transcription factor [Microbacterium imperiale]GLJ79264.1 DNA-binding response regulator [Microbacterium imperiale]
MQILVAEDERVLADALADGLRREGYAVDVAYDGFTALTAFAEREIDLLILDRDLPGLTGDAVCRSLRSEGHPVRILMLTAAGALGDRVAGLDLGADDYVTKPFAYIELLARIRALARRAAPTLDAVLDGGGIRMDTVRRVVERDGRPVSLTPKEYGVLECLLRADGGWVLTGELLSEVWDHGGDRDPAIVKATVHNLRRKLGPDAPIESAVGRGYRIGAEDA